MINGIQETYISNIQLSSQFNIQYQKMCLLLFNLTKIIIKSISITHPLNFPCRLTNNLPCIIYEHLIWLTITGHFLKWGFLAINMVNNNRVILEVRPPIKIQSTPRRGIGKLLTLNGYSSGFTQLTLIRSVYNCNKIQLTITG